MTGFKRITALLEGGQTDRPARSLWKHFPIVDQRADSLAERTIDFQRRYDWDFVKICHNGLYSIEDWGSEIRWPGHELERGEVIRFGIGSATDWERLEPLGTEAGALGRELEVVRRVAGHFDREVPVLATVFSPLTTAIKMRGERLFEDFESDPEALRRGLSVITDTTARFATEVMRAGADGIFFATQLATRDRLSVDQYREFGREFDLPVLEAAGAGWFNLLHIHGDDPMIDRLADYPVAALNWHDRRSTASLDQVRNMSDKLFVGGVDEVGVLGQVGTPGDTAEERLATHLREAIEAAGGGLVLGPGCVVPLEVSDEAIRLVSEFRG